MKERGREFAFLHVNFLQTKDPGICTIVSVDRHNTKAAVNAHHTHEDIDALFALIWNMLKDEIVLTLNEFKALCLTALRGVKVVIVKDMYACHNFEAWFDGYIDSELIRFAKEEWTQLQMG